MEITRTVSPIDHIIIYQKWRSLQDVKARRGVDVGSDHNLLELYIGLKLRGAKPANSPVLICVNLEIQKRGKFKKPLQCAGR